MTYRHKEEWIQYLTEKDIEETSQTIHVVSKDAPVKIKDEIRELNDYIVECGYRSRFVFEGED